MGKLVDGAFAVQVEELLLQHLLLRLHITRGEGDEAGLVLVGEIAASSRTGETQVGVARAAEGEEDVFLFTQVSLVFVAHSTKGKVVSNHHVKVELSGEVTIRGGGKMGALHKLEVGRRAEAVATEGVLEGGALKQTEPSRRWCARLVQ